MTMHRHDNQDQLNAISTTTANTNDTLIWNGTTWNPSPPAAANGTALSALTTVSSANATDRFYIAVGNATSNGITFSNLAASVNNSAIILAPTASTRNVIQPSAANVIPFVIKGAANQSANIEEWQTSANVIVGAVDVSGNRVFPKASGIGIKVDTANAVFGWKDLIGQIVPHASGGTAPSSLPIRGNATHIRAYAFSVGDVIDDVTFHMPHDYAPGTDIYAHIHWTHPGTAISGNFAVSWYATYCKGYNQTGQTFAAEKNITQTIATANVTAYPQYGHFIEEFQITNNGGDSTHLDTSILEVDGLIKVSMTVTAIPTITGAPTGSANEPFILMVDLHYQSTQLATKARNGPAFYT